MPSQLKPQKPYKLRHWKADTPAGPAHLSTCARPGRTSDPSTKDKRVPDETVHRWVLGLHQHCGDKLAIISLLGRKHGPEGPSEFSFYDFSGEFDTVSERENLPTFQEWLNSYYGDSGLLVHEHPTYDFAGHNTFAPGTLDNIKADIEHLLSQGYEVVIMDSGGETRTGMVATHMGAKEDFSSKA